MGLTIDYRLRTDLATISEVRTLIKSARQFARELPFEKVGKVVEFQGQEARFERGKKDPNAWFKIKSGTMIKRGTTYYPVDALQIIGFETWPGAGCESANFCLARYPATITVEASPGRFRELSTRLAGWCYSSTCKTQYASNPKNGGIEHFLRCHLSVVTLLDFIRDTGLVNVRVWDGGGYWKHRDMSKLARKVCEWNELVAAVIGGVDSAIGKRGVRRAPITEFADFEHLEAKGLKRVQKLFDRKRKKRPGARGDSDSS